MNWCWPSGDTVYWRLSIDTVGSEKFSVFWILHPNITSSKQSENLIFHNHDDCCNVHLFHYSPCIKQLEDLSVDDVINKVCLGSLFQGESCSSSPKKVKKKYSKIKLLRKQPANMFRCIIFCYLTQCLTEIGSTFVCVSSTEVILALLGEKWKCILLPRVHIFI